MTSARSPIAFWAGFGIVLGLLIVAPLVLPEFWRRFVTEEIIPVLGTQIEELNQLQASSEIASERVAMSQTAFATYTLVASYVVLVLMAVFIGANFVAAIFLTWMPSFLNRKFDMSLSMAGLNSTAWLQIAVSALVQLQPPVIAAVHGFAAGGGGFGLVVIGPSCWRWIPGYGRVYVCAY